MLFRRGVALNCTLNSELADSGLFDRVLIHPASHDSGTALGGCFYVNAKLGRHHPIAFKSACLGPSYSDGLVRKTLESGNLSYEELNESELARRCAEDISKGLIVGWFQGRMEWVQGLLERGSNARGGRPMSDQSRAS